MVANLRIIIHYSQDLLSSMSGLEKTIKLLPLLSILIITLGFVYYRAFYMSFGIRIVDYLELSEILTLFLDELYIFYTSVAFLVVLYISIQNWKYTSEESKNLSTLPPPIQSIRQLKKSEIVLIIVGALLIIIFFGGIPYLFIQNRAQFADLIPILSISVYIGFFIVASLASRSNYKAYFFNPYAIILFIILILNASGSFAKIRVHDITCGHVNSGTDFILDNSLIQSDSVCYYLGKTKNFLFYYDAEQQKATAYPMSRIKKMSFTQ